MRLKQKSWRNELQRQIPIFPLSWWQSRYDILPLITLLDIDRWLSGSEGDWIFRFLIAKALFYFYILLSSFFPLPSRRYLLKDLAVWKRKSRLSKKRYRKKKDFLLFRQSVSVSFITLKMRYSLQIFSFLL